MKKQITKQLQKIFLLGMVFSLFAAHGISAQQNINAVIQELSGTVEIKQPGSANWENAVRGQTLAEETMISTGFRSTAIIALGNSLLTVRPLTRLSLGELRRLEESERVEGRNSPLPRIP